MVRKKRVVFLVMMIRIRIENLLIVGLLLILVLSFVSNDNTFQVDRLPCSITSDTTFYDNGNLKMVKFTSTDIGCVNKNRKQIPFIIEAENCWDCWHFKDYLDEDDSTFSATAILSRRNFVYTWWNNGKVQFTFQFKNINELLTMDELEFDSTGTLINTYKYYFVKDSIFSTGDSLFYTSWYRDRTK